MMWQDVLLAVGCLGFSVALIPSIRSADHKPALSTSVVTGGILLAFTVAYGTLGLWLAMASDLLLAGCWGVLAVQRIQKVAIRPSEEE